MLLTVILFFLGFYILIRGAGFLVDGSSAIARRFHLSPLLIGLVVAGIGTSIPEFAISFIANLTGEGSVGLGTIIGSNTFNILFILGFTALVFPLTLRAEWVHRDLIWNVLAVFVAASFAVPLGDGIISRYEGLFMLALFVFWMYRVIKRANHNQEPVYEPIRIVAIPLAFMLIVAGLAGVIFGGKWIVDGAAVMARELGMSEALIGLTIVGIGTSLPEFAVTFVAALRGRVGIAVGNIIGSNIFDFLMILGFAALVKPIVFPPDLFLDIVVTILSASLLYGFMFMGQWYVLQRSQGLFLALLYILYLVYLVGRG